MDNTIPDQSESASRDDSQRRPYALAKGLLTVPGDFDDPLPANELKLFEGSDESQPQ